MEEYMLCGVPVAKALFDRWEKFGVLGKVEIERQIKEKCGLESYAPEIIKLSSVEETLAERGSRYGDFTDHAEICQRIKLAMIAGSARWTRLSDVQKQALEVIADKIARILSGDPNYADNWHDIQGYAKLVEDRLPKEQK